ncbi:DUF4352 domain-containing protein [Kitasatospora mediocidica]|uniref:DUF4352 domain-containing protein n=1 Tax=Kitasatospora mediocidica TaxID=58352 RepID=UPI000563502E|nr:DUF4352 domain-containing protein [Kitasatospora mediocidica]
MRITATRRRTSATLLASAVLIALATTACGPTATSSVSTQPKQSAAAGAPGSAKPAGGTAKTPTVAKIGDTIALKGQDAGSSADVTVVKVVDNAQSSDDYSKPADGKRWIAVQFRIKNTGSTAYSDAPENGTTVLDGQGQSYNSVVADTTAGQSFAVPANIATGDSALGFITFEVPKDTKLEKVQFTLDSGFANQTGQWTLA